jgi:hypothetical protein
VLNSTYYGGLNFYPGGGDTIEDPNTHNFEISSATAVRSGINNSVLTITINTNFAGLPGSSVAVGTDYGSLFLTPGNSWNPVGTAPHYPEDTYHAGTPGNPGEWTYAVVPSTKPNNDLGTLSGSGGAAGLYAIGNDVSKNVFTGNAASGGHPTNANVAQTYTMANGTIIMSNVHGDPVSYKGQGQSVDGNPWYYFREGQAVQFVPDAAVAPVDGATWSVIPTTFNSDGSVNTEGSITYIITDNGLLTDTFSMAWSITCANDVVAGLIDFTGGNTTTTPLPSTALLMGSVLGAGGFLSKWRRRKRQAAKAA